MYRLLRRTFLITDLVQNFLLNVNRSVVASPLSWTFQANVLLCLVFVPRHKSSPTGPVFCIYEPQHPLYFPTSTPPTQSTISQTSETPQGNLKICSIILVVHKAFWVNPMSHLLTNFTPLWPRSFGGPWLINSFTPHYLRKAFHPYPPYLSSEVVPFPLSPRGTVSYVYPKSYVIFPPSDSTVSLRPNYWLIFRHGQCLLLRPLPPLFHTSETSYDSIPRISCRLSFPSVSVWGTEKEITESDRPLDHHTHIRPPPVSTRALLRVVGSLQVDLGGQ